MIIVIYLLTSLVGTIYVLLDRIGHWNDPYFGMLISIVPVMSPLPNIIFLVIINNTKIYKNCLTKYIYLVLECIIYISSFPLAAKSVALAEAITSIPLDMGQTIGTLLYYFNFYFSICSVFMSSFAIIVLFTLLYRWMETIITKWWKRRKEKRKCNSEVS